MKTLSLCNDTDQGTAWLGGSQAENTLLPQN